MKHYYKIISPNNEILLMSTFDSITTLKKYFKESNLFFQNIEKITLTQYMKIVKENTTLTTLC